MKEHPPDLLYRLTIPDKLKFSEDGFLEPHKQGSWSTRVLFGGRVPMITEQDWLFIARHFGLFREQFLRLTITSSLIQDLDTAKHVDLSGPEFFGRVPREAIARIELCGWEKDNPIVLQEFSCDV